ncbi:MAG: TlpA family protein disulfide reductase [Bryobacterales bacterium]|nr:TlpA family protein disulfide reductase [Bryobacterales bacterium]
MKKLVVLFVGMALLTTGQGLSGRRAPSFALPDSTLRAFDILDYRGRWLLLEFMKTDCPHCKLVAQTLEQLKPKLGARVAVLAIVVPPDNTATVSKYIAETKTTTPILFDSGQTAMWYFNATPAHPSFDAPHLFAINPQGNIVRDWTQAGLEAPGFAAELEALIAGGSGKK